MTDQSIKARLVSRTIPSDDLTPILAYRRLVSADERDAPSFLLESVEVGGVMGRWSYLGANPQQLVEARLGEAPPWDRLREASIPLSRSNSPDDPPFRGGWVGWTAYEAAAWSEPTAIRPNADQLGLAFGLYLDTVAFDHVRKVVHRSAGPYGRGTAVTRSSCPVSACTRARAYHRGIEMGSKLRPTGT